MVYGSTARIRHPSGQTMTESLAPFAFSAHLLSGANVRLGLMHDSSLSLGVETRRGNLKLHDSPAELHMVATLPTGDVYDDVLKLVQDGDAAELSVEMRVQDEVLNGDRRIVRKAALPGIAVVDRGAYQSRVEVRRAGKGVAGRVDYGKDRVTANSGRTRKERFRPEAFEYNIKRLESAMADMSDAIERGIEAGAREALQDALDATPDINLLHGIEYNGAIASVKARSLKLNDTPEGLEFEAEDISDTAAGRELLRVLGAGVLTLGVVPLFQLPPSETVSDAVAVEPEPGNPDVDVRVINAALLTAIGIVNRAPTGNPGQIEVRSDLVEQDDPGPRPWRRLVWL